VNPSSSGLIGGGAMKLKWLAIALLLLSAAALGQVTNQTSGALTATGGTIGTCYPTITATGACFVFINYYGALGATFEEMPTGTPTGVSISIYPCMRGGTCGASADTNTSTSAATRPVTFNGPYDVWVAVVTTLTGGTSPTMTINLKASTAGGGSSGSGSNVTVVGPLDGSGNVKVNCEAGCGSSGSVNQGAAAAGTAGWPVVGGNIAETTTSWTSATAANTALTMTVTGYNSVEVYFNQTTTLTGGAATFEISDTTGFTNAYPANCAESNAFSAGSTYTFVASTNQAWDCDVSAAVAFRVRLSTTITGTGTVNLGMTANAMPTVPEVVVGGTVTTTPPSNATTNLTQWNSVALGSPSAYGTSPGTVNVPGVNSFVTNTVNVQGIGTPSDSVANPTTAVNAQAFNMAWNPTSSDWDRIITDEAGQNVGPTGVLGIFCGFNTSPTTITSGNFSPLGCDNADNLLVKINAALPAGANTIGAVTQASGPWTSNVTQFGGTNVSTGTGVGGAGIPRVTISSDSSLAANQSVNVAQQNGVALASPDPCAANARLSVVVSITANTNLITGTSGKKTYICWLQIQVASATAENVALVEGTTGGTCGSSTLGMAGGNTAALGWNLLGYGQVTGGGYTSYAYKTTVNNNDVCLFLSGSVQVSGVISYVQQ
jgi:hypothetical protein